MGREDALHPRGGLRQTSIGMWVWRSRLGTEAPVPRALSDGTENASSRFANCGRVSARGYGDASRDLSAQVPRGWRPAPCRTESDRDARWASRSAASTGFLRFLLISVAARGNIPDQEQGPLISGKDQHEALSFCSYRSGCPLSFSSDCSCRSCRSLEHPGAGHPRPGWRSGGLADSCGSDSKEIQEVAFEAKRTNRVAARFIRRPPPV